LDIEGLRERAAGWRGAKGFGRIETRERRVGFREIPEVFGNGFGMMA
jgi:hypothetical protein